jgi:16S rRNA processing protein RimM
MAGTGDSEFGIRDAETKGSNESRIPNPESREDWDDMALVGRIARPHGLRGQVAINPETDFIEERFAEGATVWTRSPAGDERLTIASMRVQNGRPIVAFNGFTRVEDVERLLGLELRVPEGALQPLQPGTWYEHQLVGCAVETTAGDVVGEVAKVEGGAGASRLVMNGPRGEILIPLAVDICVEIDVANKKIRINPPGGLLELNEVRHRHDLSSDDRGRARGRSR